MLIENTEQAQAPQMEPQAYVDLYKRLCRPIRVRNLFDRYADFFDTSMVQLRYEAPRILSIVVEVVMPGRADLRVLDLGCGTGLAGQALRPLASRLEGVDLSPAMVEKARAREIYDGLEVGDLNAALSAEGPAYDLIVAADVLVYLGDLAPTVDAAADRLRPEGTFCFTLEAKDGDGYECGPWGRWLHSEAYVRSLAASAGLEVAALVHVTPRHNAGQPVDGLAVALKRTDNATPKSPDASGVGALSAARAAHRWGW